MAAPEVDYGEDEFTRDVKTALGGDVHVACVYGDGLPESIFVFRRHASALTANALYAATRQVAYFANGRLLVEKLRRRRGTLLARLRRRPAPKADSARVAAFLRADEDERAMRVAAHARIIPTGAMSADDRSHAPSWGAQDDVLFVRYNLHGVIRDRDDDDDGDLAPLPAESSSMSFTLRAVCRADSRAAIVTSEVVRRLLRLSYEPKFACSDPRSTIVERAELDRSSGALACARCIYLSDVFDAALEAENRTAAVARGTVPLSSFTVARDTISFPLQ